MTSLLEKTSSKNKTLILLGDFNINLLKSKTDNDVTDFFDLISCFSLLPHIILPARASNTSETLIDNIFFNLANYNIISANIISTISDHFPQFLILNNYICSPNTINKPPKRNWKKINEKTFLSDISKITWDNTLDLDANDVNKSFKNFYNCINSPCGLTCTIHKTF